MNLRGHNFGKQKKATRNQNPPGREIGNFKCEGCGVTKKTTRHGQAVCSEECRTEVWGKQQEKRFGIKMSRGTTGALSELLAGADFMKRGYEVYRAMSPASHCDLVITKRGSNKFLGIEVRTGHFNKNGSGSFHYSSKDKGKTFSVVIYRNENVKILFFNDKKESIDIDEYFSEL